VVFRDPLPLPGRRHARRIEPVAVEASGTAEQEVGADFQQLVAPEGISVQDVGRVDLGRDTAGEVFNGLAGKSAVDRRVVAVGFGVRLLQQRQPRLVLITALRKVQRTRARLVSLAVLFFRVLAVDFIPDAALFLTFFVVGGSKVELVVDDGLLPFAVWTEGELGAYFRGRKEEEEGGRCGYVPLKKTKP